MFQNRVAVSMRALGCFLTLFYLTLASPLVEKRQTDYHWVDTWTSMPQLVEPDNLPPSPFVRSHYHSQTYKENLTISQKTSSSVFNDATIRQTLHFSIATTRLRVQLSNTFGTTDLPITAASLALPNSGKAGVNGIASSPIVGLTFNGVASITIPRGAVAYSDPVDFAATADSNVALNLYLAKGQQGTSITGHPGSRTTIWMQAGNHVNATTVPGTSVKHWYAQLRFLKTFF